MRTGNAMNNWKERYNSEVKNQTRLYEAMNAKAPTIVRQVTPEEIEAYNRALHKSDYFKIGKKQTQT